MFSVLRIAHGLPFTRVYKQQQEEENTKLEYVNYNLKVRAAP